MMFGFFFIHDHEMPLDEEKGPLQTIFYSIGFSTVNPEIYYNNVGMKKSPGETIFVKNIKYSLYSLKSSEFSLQNVQDQSNNPDPLSIIRQVLTGLQVSLQVFEPLACTMLDFVCPQAPGCVAQAVCYHETPLTCVVYLQRSAEELVKELELRYSNLETETESESRSESERSTDDGIFEKCWDEQRNETNRTSFVVAAPLFIERLVASLEFYHGGCLKCVFTPPAAVFINSVNQLSVGTKNDDMFQIHFGNRFSPQNIKQYQNYLDEIILSAHLQQAKSCEQNYEMKEMDEYLEEGIKRLFQVIENLMPRKNMLLGSFLAIEKNCTEFEMVPESYEYIYSTLGNKLNSVLCLAFKRICDGYNNLELYDTMLKDPLFARSLIGSEALDRELSIFTAHLNSEMLLETKCMPVNKSRTKVLGINSNCIHHDHLPAYVILFRCGRMLIGSIFLPWNQIEGTLNEDEVRSRSSSGDNDINEEIASKLVELSSMIVENTRELVISLGEYVVNKSSSEVDEKLE